MCGITGFVGEGTRDDLERMTRVISYRGPDGEGYFFDARQGIGLGHRRLSIIDVAGGGQPIFNEDGNVAVIFNGEIYNFKKLRESLEPCHKFATKTDTEVIVHLYEEVGEALFAKLDGMFAIALYDIKSRKLILARDRMGKKPLYFGVFNGTLIFGSELKALIQHPLFKKEINMKSLYDYLSYEYVPTPRSIFADVYKLEPASYLVWEKNQIKKNEFWQFKGDSRIISFAEAKLELEKCINESVRRRLVSDVPLGVFLSGGLDSSTIAYYGQKNSDTPLNTFSIGFDDSSFDESNYARRVSAFLGTTHYEKKVTPEDLLDALPAVFSTLDEPLADPSIIPTYILSRFAKERVTVALGGDGGDELFAGYPTFQADKIWNWYRRLPIAVQKILHIMVMRLPVGYSNFSFDFKLKKFMEGAFEDNLFYRHQKWLGAFNHEEKNAVLRPEFNHGILEAEEYGAVDLHIVRNRFSDERNQNLFVYQRMYMMDEVLVKVDRASMQSSLEVRSPFLDREVVEFVNQLPYEYKLNGFTTKFILKELMKDKLPSDIMFRKKKGFGIPLGRWLRSELKGFCNDLLSSPRIENAGIFNVSYVERLKKEHFEGTRDHRKKLWTLLAFEMWRENFLK